MTQRIKLRLLRIESLPATKVWYSDMLGQLVPLQGFEPGSWRSREPSGHVNFIAQKHAAMEVVLVTPEQLTLWPWCWGEPVAAPAQVASIGRKTGPLTGCKDRCDMLGVCRDLPDCEDALGRARCAKPKPTTAAPALGQSHRASAIEATTNIVVGFGISVGITAVLLPALGHQVTLAENVGMTSVFTVASFARAYGLRRLFNLLQTRAAR